MTHKEHVEKALEEAIPFINSRGYGGVAHIMHDALELLKEQYAVRPDYEPTTLSWSCGNCGQPFDRCKYKYCPNCGRAVKWE